MAGVGARRERHRPLVAEVREQRERVRVGLPGCTPRVTSRGSVVTTKLPTLIAHGRLSVLNPWASCCARTMSCHFVPLLSMSKPSQRIRPRAVVRVGLRRSRRRRSRCGRPCWPHQPGCHSMTAFESPSSLAGGLRATQAAVSTNPGARAQRVRHPVVLEDAQHRSRGAQRAGDVGLDLVGEPAVVDRVAAALVGVVDDQLVAGGDPRDERLLEARRQRLEVADLLEHHRVVVGQHPRLRVASDDRARR